MIRSIAQLILGGGSPFERSFRANEYAAISQRGGGKTLLWLSIIVGATLAALAFGTGSLDQLRERMDNPFTNIVDKGIYYGDRGKFEVIRKALLSDGSGAAMGLDTITDWTIYTLNVFPPDAQLVVDSKPTRILRGRTVTYNSSLFNFVFISENILYGQDFRGSDFAAADNMVGGGIIIKASVLEELGYRRSEFPGIESLPVFQNTPGVVFQLPVHAIVVDLPSNADFVSSKDFYLSLFGDDCANRSFVINREGDNNLSFTVPAASAEQFEAVARQLIADAAAELEIERTRLPADGRRELERVALSVRVPYVRSREDFYASLLKQLTSAKIEGWVPFASYARTREACKKDGAQQASFVFNRLDNIREFRAYLLEQSGIDLPIEVVENKENFAMVSRLGYSVGIMLLLFSVVSICFFIRNLIEGHLNSVKPNLGTFKAFGMPNRDLVRHYQRILLTLLVLAVAFGLLLAVAIGGLTVLLWGSDQFNLANGWVLGSIVIIFGSSLLFSRSIVRNILSHTPGDLVYGRS